MTHINATLAARYPGFELNAEFSVPARGITGIFGRSGSGKTTLLRCIAGLQPARGRLQVGDDIWQDDAHRRIRSVQQRGVGYVFQAPRLFPHLDVAGNLAFGYARTPPQQRRVQWDHAIDVMGLAPLLARKISGLSGGEQQRVALARALLASPGVLLMDEPAAALDEQRKREVLPFVRRAALEFNIPMLMVSHDLRELLQLADSLLVLEQGRVVAAGSCNEVLLQPALQPQFGEFTGVVLDAQVVAHEAQHGLTRLDCHGQALWVPQRDAAIGQAQRIFVAARSVSLALEPIPVPYSVLNALRGVVIAIDHAPAGAASVFVTLDVGARLLVSVTRKSLEVLKLRIGQPVVAYVKAVTLD